MNLTIVGNTFKIDRHRLEKVAKATFSFMGDLEGNIELKFISINKMIEINNIYRRINMPTDVLSFSLSKSPLVGQVFICYTYTKNQATFMGKELIDEVSLLLVHGILHIYGLDHKSKDDENKMQNFESKILKAEEISR